ncbi:MAG: tetratricopeptide repeat protein [Candidatus Zixiibacteriota bacterium]|nr:MAG: tetratricopeptide repeat protein [candidate division Zixibacteria bacterium]
MIEYILALLALFFGAVAFYLGYERFTARRRASESSTYVQALIDLLDGKQESAFGRLRQVVAEDTDNIDAYLRLGQILRENGRANLALQVHKDLTLRSGLSRQVKAQILKQLALDYIAAGEPTTAEQALAEMIKLDSRDRWANTTLLGLQEKSQNWEAAYNTASQILKLQADKSKKPLARFKVELGRELLKKREYHKSRIVLKEAIGLDPSCVQAYLYIGDSYAEEERFEDAANYWTKLITAVPEKGHVVIERLKKTLFDLGRFGDIVGICNTILEHDPKNIEGRRTLAEFHEKKGDLSASVEILEKVVDDYPADFRSVLELVRIYLEKGDSKKIGGLLRSMERRLEVQRETGVERPADGTAVGA